MDVLPDPFRPPAPPKPRKQHPNHAMDFSELPVFPSSIPAPFAIAPAALPAHLHPRHPLSATSINTLRPTGPPSSSSKPAPRARKAKGKAAASIATASASEDGGTPGPAGTGDVPAYLAPDYLLNPAGPASNAETDFKCPQCDKIYRGKHARSIWRRHLQDKHGIPLSAQPRRTRWDNDANRPKTEEEKRLRTLDSKRRWARKNRAEKSGKGSGAHSDFAPEPSIAGSVGTPASDAGEGDESADADSSFDATSVAGWGTEGAAAMNGMARGGSVPAGSAGNPFFPYSAAQGGRALGKPGSSSVAALDPYGQRPPLRTTTSMPAAYAAEDARYGAHYRDRDASPYGDAEHRPAYHYVPASGSGGNSPFHPSANPYSHPFLAHEQPHYAQPPPPNPLYESADASHGIHPLNPLLHPPPQSGYSHLHPHHHPHAHAHSHHPHVRRSPSSTSLNGGGGMPHPYDHPSAGHHLPHAPSPVRNGPPVLAGQPAPVALPYYARRQSPARVITAGGAIKSPLLGGELKSPVKLAPIGSGARRAGASSAAGTGGDGAPAGKEHPQDAAGILLALKAGPSSPAPVLSLASSAAAAANVRSPVSNLRDRDAADDDYADDDEVDQLVDDEDDEDERSERDAVEVQRLMLASRRGVGGGGPPMPVPVGSTAPVAPVISPRKRGRSESPAPSQPLPASSSSNGSGTAAAAQALLATAKKAHSTAAAGAGLHGWSLTATPTPGGLMQSMMESSPAVRFGGVGRKGGRGAESEGELGDGDDEDEEHGAGYRGGEREPFTSSSGGARHRRRNSHESPTKKSRRGGAAGGRNGAHGSSSGASSSSQARPLHHHHPVGLTSELGDFDLQQHSSSVPRGAQHPHHHHDPLRETAMLPPHPDSSSSTVSGYRPSHLTTPAPASSATAAASKATASNGDAMLLSSAARPTPPLPQHHHDPFLASSSAAGNGTLTLSGLSGTPLASAVRTSSPPFSASLGSNSAPTAGMGNFLFSSPAHPQFSRTLGLAPDSGPGVLYTSAAGGNAVGGETPARGLDALGVFGVGGGKGRAGREREVSGGSIVSLDGVLAADRERERARMRERMDEVKTPVTARVGLVDGVVGRRTGPNHNHGRRVSDSDADLDAHGAFGEEPDPETDQLEESEGASPAKSALEVEESTLEDDDEGEEEDDEGEEE
ncbi:hypothetical protein JCM10207_008351 [Rhodosporidiobolus poonsookiae]